MDCSCTVQTFRVILSFLSLLAFAAIALLLLIYLRKTRA